MAARPHCHFSIIPSHPPQTQDLAKKLKESGGLDLMGYIEFQR